jgi:HAE1 family hydrophobic/amphiphilic exporter-1
VYGGKEKSIIVEIPRDRLQAYNLTITQISQMIGAQNIQIAGGTITEEDYNYSISTVGEYASIDDVKDTVISYKPTSGGVSSPMIATVRLRDIADVYEGFKEETSNYYMNGEPCVQIAVQKQSGTNSVQTARAVQAQIEKIRKESPSDVTITETMNTTDIIQRSVDNVAGSALQGAILAVIVLFVFLRSFRSTLIIGITIPVSLVVTLGVMFFSGMTLNLMTLAGLSLGVGMLVDNSIVILENIYTYREKGAKPKAASILGSHEMFLAIAASTLTTICVFLPLILYRKQLGMIGEIFQGLAFTVVFSLLCSLVVAVVLVPVLTSKYLQIGGKRTKELTGTVGLLDKKVTDFFLRLDTAYANAVRKVLKHRKQTVGLIALAFILSCVLIPVIGFVYMPPSASDSVNVNVTMPVGTRLENTEAVLKQLEQIVYDEVKGYKNVTLLAGSSGSYGLGAARSYTGTLTVNLPTLAERIDTEDEIKTKLRAHFDDFPGATFEITSGNSMQMGGGNAAIDIKVKSEDMAKARNTANAIKSLLEDKLPQYVTEPQISMKDGLPRVNIIIDRERLYSLGLNIYSVGQEIRANIAGTTASRFRKDGEETDIVLMLAERDKARIDDLEQIFVTNNQGERIPVSSFARYEEGLAPISIDRENQSRVISVTAGMQPKQNLSKVQAEVERVVKQGIPEDSAVRIEFAGDFEDMMKAIKQFIVIILMAAILVFAVMASQFESLLDPFIVLFTLPLCVIGVVFIFGVTGSPLNVMTAVGLLILVGVIVNNGIVLVDYTNLLCKRGMPLMEACVEAARSRLRPILMTTLTTVLALVPMAFFPGEGSEMVQPIGKTILGGLSFGTCMTLFLMPVLYYIFNSRRQRREARKAARRERELMFSTGGEE